MGVWAQLRFGSFSLGIVVGCLLAGVLIGQLDIKVPPVAKAIFFDLFLFTTGYKVGPQFFRGLNRLAIPEADKAAFINAIPVAYAVTYLIGPGRWSGSSRPSDRS